MYKIFKTMILFIIMTFCCSCGICAQFMVELIGTGYRPGEYIRIRDGEYKTIESVTLEFNDIEYIVDEVILVAKTISEQEYIEANGVNVKARVLTPEYKDDNYFFHRKNEVEYYKLNLVITLEGEDPQVLILRQTKAREDTYQYYLFETTIQIEESYYDVVLVVEVYTYYEQRDMIHLKFIATDLNSKISDRFVLWK